MSVMLRLMHVPEDRERVLGPFPYVQATYDSLDQQDGEPIARFDCTDGRWVTLDQLKWTDWCVYATADEKEWAADRAKEV